jgi:uncharacterized membrane protein SpoIIM required for sporulation
VIGLVNFWAVLLAAAASMALGYLWYSPMLFGKQWMQLSGTKEKEVKKEKKQGGTRDMVLETVKSLVMAYVLAAFISRLGITTTLGGTAIGFLAWLGFIGTNSLGSVIWERKPKELWMLNNAYSCIAMMLMGFLIGWIA